MSNILTDIFRPSQWGTLAKNLLVGGALVIGGIAALQHGFHGQIMDVLNTPANVPVNTL